MLNKKKIAIFALVAGYVFLPQSALAAQPKVDEGVAPKWISTIDKAKQEWIGTGSSVQVNGEYEPCILGPAFKKENGDVLYYLGSNCSQRVKVGEKLPILTRNKYVNSGWSFSVDYVFQNDPAHLGQVWGKLERTGQTNAQVLKTGYIAGHNGTTVWPVLGTRKPEVGLKVVRDGNARWYQSEVKEIFKKETPQSLSEFLHSFSVDAPEHGAPVSGESLMYGNYLVGVGSGASRNYREGRLGLSLEGVELGFKPALDLKLITAENCDGTDNCYLEGYGITPRRN
ncbi:hypothetical protein [Austwickia chelonae]|uniref:Uncharacterized protein n=1 Tax=Austwickia chelonae NBRC 105200 TaxID=1184607 RepID=K6VTJ8_9MICO|nr:hypothetical protein [Austwickia chelonae]GAB78660.1 hypothetical protein AUCHE_16_00780 [Austwickia chelonae NBRC 105200]